MSWVTEPLRKALTKKIPLWGMLIGVIATASVVAGLSIVPGLLSPRPSFSISSSSYALVAQANAQNPLNLTLKSQNGFTGVVQLETLPSSTISIWFSPDTVPLGHISNSTLWIDPLSAGNYSITIVARTLGITRSIEVSVIAEDLRMAFSPASLTIARNTSANVTLTLSSLNGLEAYLNLPGYVSSYELSAHVTGSGRIFIPRGGIVTTIMGVYAGPYATTIAFPFEAQICPDPYSCFSPIPSPPAPLWKFSANYNVTIT